MKAVSLLITVLTSFASALPPGTSRNDVSPFTRKTPLEGPVGFTTTETQYIRRILKDSAAMAKTARDAVETRFDLVQEYFKLYVHQG